MVYQYSQLTAEVMLNLYLYANDAAPSSNIDASLIRPNDRILKIDVDPVSFMSSGLGRFARLAQSPLV